MANVAPELHHAATQPDIAPETMDAQLLRLGSCPLGHLSGGTDRFDDTVDAWKIPTSTKRRMNDNAHRNGRDLRYFFFGGGMEREKRLELSTYTLARYRSTN